MRYAKPAEQIVAINIDKHLETLDRKLHIRLSQIGSKILAESDKQSFKIKIFSIGESIVMISKIRPTIPIEFFIKIELVKIKLRPSAR